MGQVSSLGNMGATHEANTIPILAHIDSVGCILVNIADLCSGDNPTYTQTALCWPGLCKIEAGI